ncbi:MAG TPA: hypothetical protein VGV64_00925 [Thermoplasmata archaeon]|nr:hypothetical protein [Thermoplasmata archaeon]
MKASRAILVWSAAVVVLLFVEVAELTHVFTLPLQSAIGNLIAFIFALVFITILALVGALFIGIYISQRMQSPGGFTPFEEEMLKMRALVERLTEEVAELRRATEASPEKPAPPRGSGGERP